MHQDQAIKIFSKIFKRIGSKWDDFIADVKKAADPEDESQIKFSDFLNICGLYNAKLKSQKD